MGNFLTTESTMTCPHGGQVTAISSNVQVQAGDAYVLRATDTFTIAGCSFSVPGIGPSPCLQVQWITEAEENSVGGNVLTEDSQAMCIGALGVQGMLLVDSTQTDAGGV